MPSNLNGESMKSRVGGRRYIVAMSILILLTFGLKGCIPDGSGREVVKNEEVNSTVDESSVDDSFEVVFRVYDGSDLHKYFSNRVISPTIAGRTLTKDWVAVKVRITVLDGDSFKTDEGDKVFRLMYVDAPEAGQKYYVAAKENLKRLLRGVVTLLQTDVSFEEILKAEYKHRNDARVSEVEQFFKGGRKNRNEDLLVIGYSTTVGNVEDGRIVTVGYWYNVINWHVIHSGYAAVNSEHCIYDDECKSLLKAAEWAQNNKYGIWNDSDFIYPWQYRVMQRDKAANK